MMLGPQIQIDIITALYVWGLPLLALAVLILCAYWIASRWL